MQFLVKQFNDLSTTELFEIYKLRSMVFVVEQNCPYQDVDDKDLEAYHVLATNETGLIGYSRILPPGHNYRSPRIGRVVVAQPFRKNGNGRKLMQFAIDITRDLFKERDIVISAQKYLLKFYTDLGFKTEGEDYLEDDIPHIKMRLKHQP